MFLHLSVILFTGGGMRGRGRGLRAGDTATEAGGTHPTGMHSCFLRE